MMLIRPQVIRPRPRTFSTAQGQAKAKATTAILLPLPYKAKIKQVMSFTYCSESQLITIKQDNSYHICDHFLIYC